MSVLSDLRDQVCSHLESAGLHAFTMKPDRFAPPAVFVGPGSPYVTREGANFGNELVRHSVTVVAAAGTNEKRANDLDEDLLKALDALYVLDGFGVGEVGQPGQIRVGGESYLATSIEVATDIHRNPPG